ncbi:TadE/TadG family type IV pilus assembly protein [Xinfangfangia sp. CPCC 101601]|uniref:TadE/TadG family type IV pilus assembly protein n=1 Tax=Pseudogemmobacter lacusdianii TaxID=3069608 RepID=A0ABU0VVD2_9RHOB|nr:TadE/TadG family type IV pilus assembly protein [Xinfangfangia sp. CPCC 101601]MDQ2065711.1 TadE/TadG family type IV pilus assembly protein [Xinfangfangia sp. CPCC 101601]
MMRRLLSKLFHRARDRARDEEGTATIEFIFVVPILCTIFMASVEAGLYMVRHVMMERGLDLVMRDVRLGRLGTFDHNELRRLICARTVVLVDCNSLLKVEMRPVSTATFALPTMPATCIDRGEETEALTTFTPGGAHEIIIVRICVVQDPIFPSTGLGLRLRPASGGGYQMVSNSIFVNEPR